MSEALCEGPKGGGGEGRARIDPEKKQKRFLPRGSRGHSGA